MNNDKLEETRSYTVDHIKKVQKKMEFFARCLYERSMKHDSSKLTMPEVAGWAAMDREPKYPYGSFLYYDKMNRYKETFIHHYSVNRHHPEYFNNPEHEMTLIDMLEMLCDWFSYKDTFTWEEGYNRIIEQCKRFNFSDTIQSLLLNTFRDFLVELSSIEIGLYEQNQQVIADHILNREFNNNGIFDWLNSQEKPVETDAKDNSLAFSELYTLASFNKADFDKFCRENGVRYSK